jgi:hypothetical protein
MHIGSSDVVGGGSVDMERVHVFLADVCWS